MISTWCLLMFWYWICRQWLISAYHNLMNYHQYSRFSDDLPRLCLPDVTYIICGRVLPWFGFNVMMSILVCIRQILAVLGSDTVCHRWVGTSLWHGISYHYRYIWDHTGIYYVIMMFQTLGWWRSGVGMKMWIYI